MSGFPHLLFPVCHIGEDNKDTLVKSTAIVWDYNQRLNQIEYGRLSGFTIIPNEKLYYRNSRCDDIVHYSTPCLPLTDNVLSLQYYVNSEITDKEVGNLLNEQYRYFKRVFNHTYFPVETFVENITEELIGLRDTNEIGPYQCSVMSYVPCWLNSDDITSEETIEGYVLYANGPNMNDINISILKSILNRSDQSIDYNKIKLCCTGSYKMPGRIYQVVTMCVDEKMLIGVRCGYYIGLFKGPSKEDETMYKGLVTNESSINLMTPIQLYQTTILTSCMCLCPYYYGEAVFITESGGLYLWDIDEGVSVIQSPLITVSGTDISHMWRCLYGPKPTSIVLCEHQCVSIVDFSNEELIYTTILKQGSLYLTSEWIISCIANHPCNPFYIFVATTDKVLLIDVRQYHEPILEIRHELPKLIHYMNVARCPWKQDEVVLMMSSLHGPYCQAIKIKGGFALNNEMILPPQVCCTVHSIDTYKNFGEELDLSSHHLNTRFSCPLVGICLIPLTISLSYCTIMTSVISDIFYQCWYYDKPPPKQTPVVPYLPPQSCLWAEHAIKLEKADNNESCAKFGKNFQILQNYLSISLADSTLCLKCVSLIHEGLDIDHNILPKDSPLTRGSNWKCSICLDKVRTSYQNDSTHKFTDNGKQSGKEYLEDLLERDQFDCEELNHLWKEWDVKKCMEEVEPSVDVVSTNTHFVESTSSQQPKKKLKIQRKGF